MPDDTSVILFGTIAKPSSSTASRFDHFSQTVQQEYTAYSDAHAPLDLIFARSADEIYQQLATHQEQLIGFHFEGRSEHYELLLALSARHRIENLPKHLGSLQALKFVFLSGCARDAYIQELLESGVPAVVTSSKRLGTVEIEHFAASVHEKLAEGSSLEDAFSFARQALGVVDGQKLRINVNLRDLPPGRKWRLPPRIVGDPAPHLFGGDGTSENKNVSQSTSAPDVKDPYSISHRSAPSPSGGSNGGGGAAPPASPGTPPSTGNRPRMRQIAQTNFTRKSTFVGNRPCTRNDADIFFGREFEIEGLLDWIINPAKPPFMLLSGAVGIGKTSLLQAGLIPQLEHPDENGKYKVYQLSAATDGQLFGKLHDELRRDSGKDDPLEAWTQIECIQNRKIVLIVDDIGAPRVKPFPGQYGEFPRLLAGLVPIFSHPMLAPKGKVLLSVRNYKLNDVVQECRNFGFTFENFPLLNLDDNHLKQAIEKPFLAYSVDGVIIENGVADEVAKLIQSDRVSPGLTYLQVLMERLWGNARNGTAYPPKITLESYQKFLANATLLDCFLEKQLQLTRKRLANRYSTIRLLQFLRFHFDAHCQPYPRSNQERCRHFPDIPAADMRQLLSELIEQRLLVHSDADKCGRLQIGHTALIAHITKQLLDEKERTWRFPFGPDRIDDNSDEDSADCQTNAKPNHCHPSTESLPDCHPPIKPNHGSSCELAPPQKPCPHPPKPSDKTQCEGSKETSIQRNWFSIRLLEIALTISVVMAVILLGVVLYGLALGSVLYLAPLQINVMSP